MDSQDYEGCCNFCGSPTQLPASSPCGRTKRTEMCGRQKLEPQNKTQLICSAKNCQIFGVHDTEPFPDYPCPARRIKAKDPNKNSLGSPVGMIASNVNFKSEGKPADIAQARFATYLKAFARLHLNPEIMWTPILLDELMREGLALYSTSEKEDNISNSPSDIYTASEKGILREFEMSGCKFQIELMKKFKLNSSTSVERGAKGDGGSMEIALADLKPALKLFFRQFKHCLVSMGTLYSLVWRSKDAYFVLDVCGRRLSDLYSDRDKGVAMLICLKTLENVRYLLMGLTNLPKVDSCSLREIKLVKVVTPSGGAVQRDYGTRSHQYDIINDDYAYLKASLHLTLNKTDLMRNRSALPVGVTALVATKMDHPATWNNKMLDKIICFGVNFCQACWVKCLANDPIHVEEFPSVFNLGQFKVNIELIPQKYEGIWHCVPGYKFTDLAGSLEKALKAEDHKLLLQINYQMYAIWKMQGFIYLLDPYRHRILGKAGQSEVYEEMEKSATLRMFRSFEVFLNTLNHILLDSNRSSPYYIHTLKVKGLQMRNTPDEEPKLDADGEVKSINEHICFEESEELCQKALGDISDYEDDDLHSDVDELELKTSSSEAEEALEEEEGGGGGPEEELEGLESSSSGEDNEKKKKTGKGAKGGKGGKSKKGSKGSKSGKSSGDEDGKGGKGKTNKSGKKGKQASDSTEVPDRKKAGETPEQDKSKKKETDDGDGGASIKKKNKADEKNKKNAEEEEAERKKAEEEEARRKKAEKEEGKRKKTEGDEAKRKWDEKEEAEMKKAEREEAEKKKAEEDEANRKKAEEESAKRKIAEEEEAKRKRQALEEAKDKKRSKNVDKDEKVGLDKTEKPKQKNATAKLYQDTNKGKDIAKDSEIVKQNTEYLQDGAGKRIDKEIETAIEKNKDTSRILDKDTNLAADKRTQRPKICHKDGAEADDESEDDFFKNAAKRFCSAPNPNRYPGYFKCPLDMAVVGSENGSYDSLCKLLQAGFQRADRILTMTPWGNFVVFRCLGKNKEEAGHYFLFDGCTCHVNRFRHLDLSIGTAGLLCFKQVHDAIEYMRRIRKMRSKENRLQRLTADEICQQYCR